MNIRIATILLSASSGLAAVQAGGVCAGTVALTCSMRADQFLVTRPSSYAAYMNGLNILNDCEGPCLSGVKTAEVCDKMRVICDEMGRTCRSYPSQCVYANPGKPVEPVGCIPPMAFASVDGSNCGECCNQEGCYVTYDNPNCPPGSMCLGYACM